MIMVCTALASHKHNHRLTHTHTQTHTPQSCRIHKGAQEHKPRFKRYNRNVQAEAEGKILSRLLFIQSYHLPQCHQTKSPIHTKSTLLEHICWKHYSKTLNVVFVVCFSSKLLLIVGWWYPAGHHIFLLFFWSPQSQLPSYIKILSTPQKKYS